MDILGPLPQSDKGNRYILVIADYFTKWAEAFPIPNQEAKTVAEVFVTEFVLRFGAPRTLHTDQGRNFESELFRHVCSLLDIHKTRTTPYHPCSDGLVERFNRTLTTMLSNFVNSNQSDWDVILPYVMMAYRSSVQSSTKFTPYEAVFGHQIVLPVDLLLNRGGECYEGLNGYVNCMKQKLCSVAEAIQRHQQAASESQKGFYDLKVSHQYYEPGEKVWVRDQRRKKGQCPKLKKKFSGPYLVLERLSDVLYRLKGSTGEAVVHFNRLKPCYDNQSLVPLRAGAQEGDGQSARGQPRGSGLLQQGRFVMPPLPPPVLVQPTPADTSRAPVVGGDQSAERASLTEEDHPFTSAAEQEGEQHRPRPPHDSVPGGQQQAQPVSEAGRLEPHAQDTSMAVGPPLPQRQQGAETAAETGELGSPARDPASLCSEPSRPQRQRKQPGWFKDFDVDVNNIGREGAILFKGGGSVMNSVYWPQWVRPANGLIMTGCRWVRHLLPVKVV